VEDGKRGLEDLDWVLGALRQAELRSSRVEFDLTLARGLNYYTGCIFEVAAPDSVRMGSIGGGGRYDDLTGIFGMPGLSGVGISFGLDRIQLVMDELGVFPDDIGASPDILVACLQPEDLLANLRLSLKLREFGIKAECFPDAAKLQKQFKYADRKGIPFLLLCGEEERARESFQLKNLSSGEQKEFSWKEEGLQEALVFMGKRT
jgi:histidyl-tRNA synthetase